jgi:hypothetical protein
VVGQRFLEPLTEVRILVGEPRRTLRFQKCTFSSKYYLYNSKELDTLSSMKKICIIIALIAIIIGYYITIGMNKPVTDEGAAQNPPNSAEGSPEGSIHNLPVPEGVKAARTVLATRLNIDSSKILILEALETDWSDSCLGLGGPAESCLQAITPGYNVLMQANGKEYRYRTNENGTSVRAEDL